jgi:hypothetical protein
MIGQGKDDGKTGINDGNREDKESCQILGRSMKIRDHLQGIGVGVTSKKT